MIKSFFGQIRFLIFWVVSGFFEIPFMEAFFYSENRIIDRYLFGASVLHVVSAIIIFFSVPREKGWFHPERFWARAYFFSILCFPFLGWVCCLALRITCSTKKINSLVFDQLENYEEEEGLSGTRIWLTRRLHRRERVFKELDFVPLADILASNNDVLKRGAIEQLIRLRTPEAIEILLKHRSDQSPDVRFFATSGLSIIKKEFDEQLEAAKKQIEKEGYKISARIYLAKIYLAYAESNLLDEATKCAYENEAHFHLKECIASPHARDEAYFLLVKLHKDRHEWQEALAVLQALRGRKGVDMMEIKREESTLHYQMGNYSALRTSLTGFEESEDSKMSSLANWWVRQ